MRKLVLTVALAACAALATAGAARAETLRIGISQYPTTLHPSAEPSVAKSYVTAMTRRPLTVYDQQWELICMLCTELPSIEAGGGKSGDYGTRGNAVKWAAGPCPAAGRPCTRVFRTSSRRARMLGVSG